MGKILRGNKNWTEILIRHFDFLQKRKPRWVSLLLFSLVPACFYCKQEQSLAPTHRIAWMCFHRTILHFLKMEKWKDFNVQNEYFFLVTFSFAMNLFFFFLTFFEKSSIMIFFFFLIFIRLNNNKKYQVFRITDNFSDFFFFFCFFFAFVLFLYFCCCCCW